MISLPMSPHMTSSPHKCLDIIATPLSPSKRMGSLTYTHLTTNNEGLFGLSHKHTQVYVIGKQSPRRDCLQRHLEAIALGCLQKHVEIVNYFNDEI